MKIDYKTYEIELKDDRSYSTRSSDNLVSYKFEYSSGQINKNRIFTINKRGIIIRDLTNKLEISSAILCENGGRTAITEDIYKIEEDKLWICVGDTMYCLKIPNLEVNWFNRVDYGANFSIHNFEEDFIVFGDLGLIRISKSGAIKWRFMGDGGIFIPGEGNLKVFEKHIELIDGNGEKYVINALGEKLRA